MKILELVNLRKEFGALTAVDDVSMSLEKGQILGLIGPNGAGKTTLLKMVATLLNPTDGDAKIFGYDIRTQYLDIRKRIGYLPDFFNLYSNLKLHECLRFFAKAYGVAADELEMRIEESLVFVELEDKRDAFVQNLSRGMVRRLGVAAMLVHGPDLFLLDEPASGLDPKARIKLREILRRLSGEGKTVIISSHILTELADFCTHVAIMDHGKLVLHGHIDEIDTAGTSRKVSISVLGDSLKAAEIIGKFDPKVTVNAVNGKIELEYSGSVETIAELNRYMVQNGIDVVGLHEQKRDLEDIFMGISGK